MNLKALMLGAALGFFVALVPSCGKTTCNSMNCSSGCCDANGKCQAAPANAAAATCGAAGKDCVDCTQTANKFCGAGSVCSATASGGGAGGGGGMGGGGGHLGSDGGTLCSASNCALGCCQAVATGLQCVTGLQNFQACGHTGETCHSCVTDAGSGVCMSGFCKESSAPGQLGDACNSDSECTGLDLTKGDGTAMCRKFQDQILPNSSGYTRGVPYPGGYCTRQCTDDSQCGNGTCGYYGGQWGEALNICYAPCDLIPGVCERSEYLCVKVNGAGACLPPNDPDGGLDTFDAGPPPAHATLGKDCTSNADCATETGYGQCELGTLPDGGPSGFGTGQCVADCTMSTKDAWCQGHADPADDDGGAFCQPIVQDSPTGPITHWQCVVGCSGGPTDCKAGYHCSLEDLYKDSTCQPDCDAPGAADDCGTGMVCLNALGCYPFECDTTTHDCKYK